MKFAKQALWSFLFYLLSLSASPASAAHLTLSASTGHTNDYITVTGSGFWPNTDGYVFFDQNYDYQPAYGSAGYKCGTFSDRPCEPYVAVTSDANGNFVTNLIIPPGKKADFLGAGTYLIGADVPIGGGSEASAPFKVPANFTLSRGETIFTAALVYVSGSYFAPYRLDGTQSYGYVWIDSNSDFTWNQGEPYIGVHVLPDGSLSACAGSPCGISLNTTGAPGGVYVRTNIIHEADTNRSTEQKLEASALLPSPPLPCFGFGYPWACRGR